MLKRVHKLSGPFFTGLGILLLISLIRKFGWHELLLTMSGLGWEVVFILVLPWVWYVSHTIGWYLSLEDTGEHLSVWGLLRIKLAGEAVNTLTPVSWMGGD